MMATKVFTDEDGHKYRTDSIRLPQRNYSDAGSYFITICVDKHFCCLSTVIDREIQLNPFGEIVKQEIHNMEENNIEVEMCVVMPNHVHMIISLYEDKQHNNCKDNSRIVFSGSNRDSSGTVGTNKNAISINQSGTRDSSGTVGMNKNAISINQSGTRDSSGTVGTNKNAISINQRNALRRNMIIPKIIGKLKMQTSKQINEIKGTPGKPFRQANYYEHIIRNDKDFERISTYITNNPLKRKNDDYYR